MKITPLFTIHQKQRHKKPHWVIYKNPPEDLHNTLLSHNSQVNHVRKSLSLCGLFSVWFDVKEFRLLRWRAICIFDRDVGCLEVGGWRWICWLLELFGRTTFRAVGCIVMWFSRIMWFSSLDITWPNIAKVFRLQRNKSECISPRFLIQSRSLYITKTTHTMLDI